MSAREDSLATETEPALQPSILQRIAWAILIALTLYVCYFSHLDVIGFVGPDEPRYAWIARDMAESGDWVTPRLYGKPWFEKPPLLYWGGAIFFKLLGEDHPETAARLPSAISALLATLALAWLAWRTYGQECARWLLLLLPTSVGMIGFSHACATDMPFAGMLTIAMVCAAVVLGLVPHTQDTPILPRTPWLALLLFGFFLGLAVLAKGPAGIILIGGAVFFWALFTKRWRDAFRLLHPAAIAAFCLTALPWYILCARRNPDFFRVFIIEHNFKRYLTPEFQHIQPFWFYLPILLVAALPWSFLLAKVAVGGCRHLLHDRGTDPFSWLFLAWSLFCLLFFTISKSKLPGYILPAIPSLFLLLARPSDGQVGPKRRDSAYVLFVSGVLYLATAICLTFVSKDKVLHGNSLWAIRIFVFLIFGLFAFSCAFAGMSLMVNTRNILRVALAGGSIFAITLILASAPRLLSETHYDLLSGKELWRALPPEVKSSSELRVSGFRRDYRYAVNFYARREIPDWLESQIENGFVVTNAKSCNSLKTQNYCRDLWGYNEIIADWSLLKITPPDSLPGPSGGRQPQ